MILPISNLKPNKVQANSNNYSINQKANNTPNKDTFVSSVSFKAGVNPGREVMNLFQESESYFKKGNMVDAANKINELMPLRALETGKDINKMTLFDAMLSRRYMQEFIRSGEADKNDFKNFVDYCRIPITIYDREEKTRMLGQTFFFRGLCKINADRANIHGAQLGGAADDLDLGTAVINKLGFYGYDLDSNFEGDFGMTPAAFKSTSDEMAKFFKMNIVKTVFNGAVRFIGMGILGGR